MTPEEFYNNSQYLSDDLLCEKSTVIRALKQYSRMVASEAYTSGYTACDWYYNSHLRIKEDRVEINDFLNNHGL